MQDFGTKTKGTIGCRNRSPQDAAGSALITCWYDLPHLSPPQSVSFSISPSAGLGTGMMREEGCEKKEGGRDGEGGGWGRIMWMRLWLGETTQLQCRHVEMDGDQRGCTMRDERGRGRGGGGGGGRNQMSRGCL